MFDAPRHFRDNPADRPRSLALAAVRDAFAEAARDLPANSVGRAARAVLGELQRHAARYAHDTGDVCWWHSRLDLGVSIDTMGRALRLVAARTNLLERLPGRRAGYRCRVGSVLAAAHREQPEYVDVRRLAQTPEIRRAAGWMHPDAALVLPGAVLARRRFGDSFAPTSHRPASPGLARCLARRGVVDAESLGHDVARVVALALARRPWLLAQRRRAAGLARGDEHRTAYGEQVAAIEPATLEAWAAEDAVVARAAVRHGRQAKRIALGQLRAVAPSELAVVSRARREREANGDPPCPYTRDVTFGARSRRDGAGKFRAQDDHIPHGREIQKLMADRQRRERKSA